MIDRDVTLGVPVGAATTAQVVDFDQTALNEL